MKRFTVVTEYSDGFLNDTDVWAETEKEAREIALTDSETDTKIIQVIESTPEIASARMARRLPESCDFGGAFDGFTVTSDADSGL